MRVAMKASLKKKNDSPKNDGLRLVTVGDYDYIAHNFGWAGKVGLFSQWCLENSNMLPLEK